MYDRGSTTAPPSKVSMKKLKIPRKSSTWKTSITQFDVNRSLFLNAFI